MCSNVREKICAYSITWSARASKAAGSNLNEWSPNRVVEDAIASNLRTDYGTHR